jgi:ATP-dependent phosphoenolpyruvate carboxykinase
MAVSLGTTETTASADQRRRLVLDDRHDRRHGE